MITGRNQSKTLTKHIPCRGKYKFNGRKCNLDQNWSNYKCQCECVNKKHIVCVKKIIFGILLSVVVKMVFT